MINSIDIIIPTVGYSENLKKTIESLSKQKTDCRVKINLIVNRCSLEELEFIKKELNQTHVIYSQHAGVNRARNIGLAEAQADLLIFLDDDCEALDENLLELHKAFHVKDPQVFAFGGLYTVASESGFFDKLYNYIQMRWLYQGVLDDQMTTKYLIGGHFSIKKNILQTHQLSFNESIIYGGSELGFFLNAHIKGLKMQLGEIAVQHNTHESFFSVAKKTFKQGVGKAVTDQLLKDFQVHHEIVSEHLNKTFIEKIFLTTYNFIFWYGYYSYKKELISFFKFIWKELLFSHMDLKNKLRDAEVSKKKRGDRF